MVHFVMVVIMRQASPELLRLNCRSKDAAMHIAHSMENAINCMAVEVYHIGEEIPCYSWRNADWYKFRDETLRKLELFLGRLYDRSLRDWSLRYEDSNSDGQKSAF